MINALFTFVPAALLGHVPPPSFADLPPVWEIYADIYYKVSDIKELLDRANKFLLAFEKLPEKQQRAAELNLVDTAIRESAYAQVVSPETDYYKLDLLRVWMHKPPIVVPDQWFFHWDFLVMSDSHLLVEGKRPPNSGGGTGPAHPPTRHFDRDSAEAALEGVKRGDFILPNPKQAGKTW